MKTILIPTDFSENSFNAIRYSIPLFEKSPCKFIFLNTYLPIGVDIDFTAPYTVAAPMDDIFNKNSKNALKQVTKRIKKEFPNCKHKFETQSSCNTLVGEINHQLSHTAIDLIVMGSQGTTGLKEFIWGSMTQKVAQHIKSCPILVIPQKAVFSPWLNIGLATNFEKPFSKNQIQLINEIALQYGSTLRVVQVYDHIDLSDKQLKNRKSLEIYLNGTRYQHHIMKKFDSVEDALHAFNELLAIDVLCLINYKHGFLEELTREPVVKKMTFHTKIPLLILAHPEET